MEVTKVWRRLRSTVWMKHVLSLAMNLRCSLAGPQQQHSFSSACRPLLSSLPSLSSSDDISYHLSLSPTPLPQHSPNPTSGKTPTLDESNYCSSLVAKHCWKPTQIGVTINQRCHSEFVVSDFKWTLNAAWQSFSISLVSSLSSPPWLLQF